MGSRGLTFLSAVALASIRFYALNNRQQVITHPPPPPPPPSSNFSWEASWTTDPHYEPNGADCATPLFELLGGCMEYMHKKNKELTDPAEYCCPAMRSVARNQPECVCEIFYSGGYLNYDIDLVKSVAVFDDCKIPPNPRMPDCKALLLLDEDYAANGGAVPSPSPPSSSPSPSTSRAWFWVLLYLSLVFFSSVVVLFIRR